MTEVEKQIQELEKEYNEHANFVSAEENQDFSFSNSVSYQRMEEIQKQLEMLRRK